MKSILAHPLVSSRHVRSDGPREGRAAKAKHMARVPRKGQEITEIIERLCGVAAPLVSGRSCYFIAKHIALGNTTHARP